MLINPDQYITASAYDLLKAVSRGLVGFDHRVLHALLDDPARTLPDILRFALEEREDDRIDLDDELISVFRHLKTPDALPFYIKRLAGTAGEDVSEELMSALREIGEPAVGPLLELYEELGEEEGGEIPYILSSFRIRDERILKVLLDRLEYDAIDGLMLIGLYGDPAARPAVEKLLQSEAAGKVREEAELALLHFEKPEPEPFPEPPSIWEQFPEKLGPYFEILNDEERIALLESTSSEVRGAAVRYFFNRELPRPLRDKIFLMARNDQAVDVRARCWEVLGSALEEKEIRAAMVAKLNDGAAPLEERTGALVGLAFECDDPAVRARVLEFYENPATRAKALETMWRSLEREFAPFFPKHLDDADLEIKRQAIWGVGYLGIGAEASRLRAFFTDEDFRDDALFAYAMSVPAEISRGRMRALLRKVDEAAGGLDPEELELVEMALDERLAFHGLDPVFSTGEPSDDELEQFAEVSKTGRNDPCPCGSGKKYKKCCGK